MSGCIAQGSVEIEVETQFLTESEPEMLHSNVMQLGCFHCKMPDIGNRNLLLKNVEYH